MPYKEDSVFSKELNDNDKVWRYVDFAKFADLLIRKQLFFVSASILVKIDPYEGYFDEIKLGGIEEPTQRDSKEYAKIYEQLKDHTREEHPKFLFVNCWHVNDFDNDAMWKLYATKDWGIAIQTTVKNLKASLESCPRRIDFCRVNYIDHSQKQIIYTNLHDRFSVKGISFKHENELRLFVLDVIPRDDYVSIDDKKYKLEINDLSKNHRPLAKNENGIYINVNLDHLIEKVYVSPMSDDWFVELVCSIAKNYGINENLVMKSKLYKKPNFTKTNQKIT